MPYVEWRGNTCRVKWWAGEYHDNGRKKYESQSGFVDEQVAYNFGLDREHDVRHGTHIKRGDSQTLMTDYCCTWLDTLDLRPESIRRYRSIIDTWIIPYWGKRPVGDITPFEVQAWQKHVKHKATSTTYPANIFTVFGMLMDDAVANKLRNDSPVIKQRRRGKYTKKTREKKRPLEMETLHALAVNAYTVWGWTGWTYIWTQAFTGMRTGEMWGLRREFAPPNWPASDPDPERRDDSIPRYTEMPAIRVQYQHQYVDGVATFTGPKYESHRTLVVPPFLAEMLKAQLGSHSGEMVFPSLSGGWLLTAGPFGYTYWHPIRDGAPARKRSDLVRPEIPPVPAMSGKRIYLLRHGHKEWLEEDGHSETASEARMGHEVAGVKGLYSNVTPAMESRIAETLQERWEKLRVSGAWVPPFPTQLP